MIFAPNFYSKEVLTALVSCFVSLQNTDESYLSYFSTIVERQISDFINILEEFCLNGGSQPNFNWVEKSIICIPHISQSWLFIEEQIKKWLQYYSLSPEKKLSHFSRKDDKDRLIALEKNQVEISEKLNNLSQIEKKLIAQLTENKKDIDTLVITAFHILAGKPLANFAPEFTKWSFGCSLNSSYSSPHKDFISLIRYNLVDWENTRTQFKQLRDDAYFEGWRRIENYCTADPCDPESREPENIIKTIQICEEINVYNSLNSGK